MAPDGRRTVHKLSHSFVARRHGIEVRSVTLQIFGGVSEIGAYTSCFLHCLRDRQRRNRNDVRAAENQPRAISRSSMTMNSSTERMVLRWLSGDSRPSVVRLMSR